MAVVKTERRVKYVTMRRSQGPEKRLTKLLSTGICAICVSLELKELKKL